MPGIDFQRLRMEITMEQVLALLHFEPGALRQPVVWRLSFARIDVYATAILLGERGHSPLLLSRMPQPRESTRALGGCHSPSLTSSSD